MARKKMISLILIFITVSVCQDVEFEDDGYQLVHSYISDSQGRLLTYNISEMMLYHTGSSRHRRAADNEDEVLSTTLINNSENGSAPMNKIYDNEAKIAYLNAKEATIRNAIYLVITNNNGPMFRLRLQPKYHLLSDKSKVVDMFDNGTINEQSLSQNCVFSGKITNKPNSTVAISNCNGLAGLIKDENNEFYIESDYIDDNQKNRPHFHKLFRRSAHRVDEKRLTRSCGQVLNNKTSGLASVVNRLVAKLQSNNITTSSPDLNEEDQTESSSNPDRMAAGGEIRQRRSSAVDEIGRNIYYMAVTVAVDYDVVQFHTRDGINNYVLTLMNIVDEIFHHESLTVAIDVVLMQILMVDYRTSINNIDPEDLGNSLSNVCAFTERAKATQGNKQDTAIYLTRRQFGAAGYAHVNGMCHEHRSCSITLEDGFSSAFVVAHEIGHVLGMQHDGVDNICGTEAGGIMAPMVESSFNQYTWSICSSEEVVEHIETYSCLFEPPTPDYHKRKALLKRNYPGVYYSPDEQCKLEFGLNSRHCTKVLTSDDICPQLWCYIKDNERECSTKNSPALDGTACGEERWCFQGHCVFKPPPARKPAVSGGWGEWTSFSRCSKTCGIGIRNRTRYCDNPKPTYGGKDCVGEYFEQQLCNTNPCLYEVDSRAEACMRYNEEVEFHRQQHEWLPFEHWHHKCIVYCQSKLNYVEVSTNQYVEDGSPCSYDDSNGICIGGKCNPIGCNRVLNSTMKFDACGVCGGDNSTCRHTEEIIEKNIRRKINPYTKIYKIPVGARNIEVTEIGNFNSRSLLALKDRITRQYFLNAKCCFLPMEEHTMVVNGTRWVYQSRRGNERIFTAGPTKSEIMVMAFVKHSQIQVRVNVSFDALASAESLAPLKEALNNEEFEPEVRRWSKCSVTCGTGTQRARMGCRNKITRKLVSRRYCEASMRRITRPCQATCRYVISEWSSCSQSCGNSGMKTRNVTCMRFVNDTADQKISMIHCRYLAAPVMSMACNRKNCLSEWRTGAWSRCSTSCGLGVQRRQIACGGPNNRNDSSFCFPEIPITHRPCVIVSCPGDVRYPLPKPCNSDYSDVCPATKRSSLCNHRSYSRVCCKTCEHYLRSHSLSAQISSGYLNSTASDEQSPSDVSEDSVVKKSRRKYHRRYQHKKRNAVADGRRFSRDMNTKMAS